MMVTKSACFAVLLLCWPLASTGQDSLRSVGVDAECEQQYGAASTACSTEANPAMKSCLQRRLSAKCATQANAPAGVARDASCQEEINAVATPCGKEFLDAMNRCTQSRLSAKCGAQLSVASQKAQQMLGRCQEEMKRRSEQLRRCLKLASTQEQNACVASISKEEGACAR